MTDESDLLAIGRILLRRKQFIVATTLLLTLLVAAIALNLAPQFSATAYVMIDPGQTKIVDAVEAVVAGSTADAATVESETRVLQSRTVADRVVAKLRLDGDPEFNPALRPPGALEPYFAPLSDMVSAAIAGTRAWLVPVLGSAPPAAPKPDDSAPALRARVIDAVLAHLSVSVDGRSRVIGVTFTSKNAATAADVVNAVADFYIVTQLEAKFDAAKTTNDWLNDRLATLREQVEAAEAAAEQYRAEHGLIQNKDVMITTQEATDIGTQLALARSQRAEAEARLHEVQGVIDTPGGTAATSAVLGSGLIQQLRGQEAEVQRKVPDLAQKLGASHPDLLSTQAELRQIQSKIGVEVGKIVQGLRNEVVAARAREASLIASLESLKGQAGVQNQSEVKLHALEREATASRTLLETFLQRAQETGSQESYQRADAHIVSKADMPQVPAFPKKKMIILAGLMGALILAVSLAFLFELLDRSFRSEEQMEDVLGIASLGLVPALKRSWGKSKRPSSYVARNPTSAYTESIRNLYAGLRLANGDRLPRTVLFASSLPGEGKTTVAVSLVSLAAASGLKAVVVDTDLRRSAIHRALGMAPGPGLVDYLRLRLPLEAVIQHDNETGIDAITAGSAAFNRPDLLGTDRMKDLLARLSEDYDIVVLDSAPLLAVADARILIHMVDKTVLLVRWADTHRETALRGLQQIVDAGNNLAGAMLTVVDLDKYAKYRYGALSRYYRRVESYYVPEPQALR